MATMPTPQESVRCCSTGICEGWRALVCARGRWVAHYINYIIVCYIICICYTIDVIVGMLYYIISYHIILYHIILYYVILCYIVL